RKMKKIVIIICSVIAVLCVGFAGFLYLKPMILAEPETEATEPIVVDDSTYISITAVGDCTLGSDVNYGGSTSFESEMVRVNYDYPHFLKLVKPFFENDDLTIVNFEGTLSNRGARRDKEYAFRGNPEYVKVLTSASVEAVNLANNHTYDYGESAFSDTKTTMTENGILWFEGNNFSITEIKGVKVGLIGSNALTYAGKTGFPKIIEKMKEQGAELIIANVHWGEELATTPNETQVKIAHSMIDNGADLVIGHHPHVLQGIEKYNGKYILYSLGNFCFGGHKNPVDKDTMIFNQVFRFKDGALTDYDYARVIPCSISSTEERNNYQPKPLTGGEFERVREKIIALSSGFSGFENVMIMENVP
ncbi:MAG: CapA family protein, partial [Clostridia bacterium]|nr:CapA family protein [Clostridia bacterium]